MHIRSDILEVDGELERPAGSLPGHDGGSGRREFKENVFYDGSRMCPHVISDVGLDGCGC
jgi:hypothetical protein